MTNFVRELKFFPAYDGRSHPRNYGISAMRLRFALVGPLGAVTVMFGTSWYVPGEPQEISFRSYTKGYPFDPLKELMQPKSWDVGYHAHAPQYEEQYPHEDCEVIGGTCYYDGSTLYGEEWVPVFLHEGSDGIFSRMEQEYAFRFLSGPPTDLTPIPYSFKEA